MVFLLKFLVLKPKHLLSFVWRRFSSELEQNKQFQAHWQEHLISSYYINPLTVERRPRIKVSQQSLAFVAYKILGKLDDKLFLHFSFIFGSASSLIPWYLPPSCCSLSKTLNCYTSFWSIFQNDLFFLYSQPPHPNLNPRPFNQTSFPTLELYSLEKKLILIKPVCIKVWLTDI